MAAAGDVSRNRRNSTTIAATAAASTNRLGFPRSHRASILTGAAASCRRCRRYQLAAVFVAGIIGCCGRNLPSTKYTGSFVMAMSTEANVRRHWIIDSHLHVWANRMESETAFPYAQAPPDELADRASTDELLGRMDEHGVTGALIVQPINHRFDHSYVMRAMKTHPDRFKGMMLHDPSMNSEDAVSRLEDLALQGFVGVRFNPYLWPELNDGGEFPKYSPMSEGAGLDVYRRCGELGLPVGVMCFQGLSLHFDDIVRLLEQSPKTTLILDHFGFTSIAKSDEGTKPDADRAFQQLLSLSKYPQVIVKISALFRLGDAPPFARVREERFVPLLRAYGAGRLMYGSDFPFVLQQPPDANYEGAIRIVESWIEDSSDRGQIMGGTAQRVFGPWMAAGAVPKA